MAELRHLRAFVAVADELSFTRAAERLHLSQQAVSKTVAQLERELGVDLLVRTRREVGLTEAGRELLTDGRRALDAADAALARARARAGGLEGALRVGATPAVGSAVTAALARRLRAAAPALSVRVTGVRPGEILASVLGGGVDAVLTRAVPPIEGLVADELAPTPAALVVPAGHRLADRAEVELRDLDGERLMVWSRTGTPYTDLLVALCRAGGARVEPVETRITGSGLLVELAELGAVTIVPAGAPVADDLRPVPLRGGVGLPLRAVRRPGRPGPAVALMLTALAPEAG
jgi:DNA-binding transcriptional LysR family regulator